MEGPQPAPAVTMRQFMAVVHDLDLSEQLENFLALPRSQQTTIWASLQDDLERAERAESDS